MNLTSLKINLTSILLVSLTTYSFSQSYTEVGATNLQVKSLSSVATGDLDNDGYADIVTTGLDESSALSTSLYFNNHDGSFTEVTNNNLPPLYNATIVLGDYNKDGFLDILLAGEGYDPISSLYKNNGDRSFTKVDAQLDSLSGTNAEFRDIDNDGDLDILIAGMGKNNDGSYSYDLRIYKNNGSDNFSRVELAFSAYASVGALGDYDNDGDLDLVIGGSALEIYPNRGDGTFNSPIDLHMPFPAGQIRWFDFNNDGKQDLLLSGRGNQAEEYFTKILENTGNESTPFKELAGTSFAGLQRQQIDLRDYNSDGTIDVLLTGTADFSNNTFVTKIYDNSGSSFSENIEVKLPQLGSGDAEWFDFDNDGDLDILLTGEYVAGANIPKTILMRNDMGSNQFSANTLPSSPGNLGWTFVDGIVTFNWDGAADKETPQNELLYNLAIGSVQEQADILYPEADLTNGKRYISTLGNAENRLHKSIKGLNDGLYYFRVQTLDGRLEGSLFSTAKKFAVGIPLEPINVVAEINDNNEIVVSWEDKAVNEFGFTIEQKSKSTGELIFLGETATNETSFSIAATSLSNDIYYFRIKAKNPNGESDFVESNPLSIGMPNDPSDFLALPKGNSITLSWTDIINETAYVVERSTTGEEGSYEKLATLNMDSISYTDTDLFQGEYHYKVKAINQNGSSQYTAVATGIILGLDNELNTYSSVSIYPNPTTERVFILLNKEIPGKVEVYILDVRGSRILQTTQGTSDTPMKLETGTLPPGTYLLKIQASSLTTSRKLLIK